jgi:hypothetical protein
MMKKLFVALCAVVLVSAAGNTGFAQETKIKPSQVPPPVLAAAAKEYPKAQLKGWEKVVEDGKTTYEATVTEGASHWTAVFAENGPLVGREDVIPVADLPAAVRDAAKAKYPGATVHSVEKITSGASIQYELGLKNASKKEAVFDSEGKLLKEE